MTDIRWQLAASHNYWWQEDPDSSSAPRQVAGDYSGNIEIDWPHAFYPRKGEHLVLDAWVLSVEEILWTPDGAVLVYLGSDRRWR